MRMKALDQVHISSVGPNTLAKGQEFEVSEAVAKNLEKRGLAARVEAEDQSAAATDNAEAEEAEGAAGSDEADPRATAGRAEKAQSAPANKAEKAHPNKGAATDAPDADKIVGANSTTRKRDRA